METETTYPIELPFGDRTISGRISVIGTRGFVELIERPTGLSREDARTALLVAVLDGRARVPDHVAVAVDLIGASPRVA